VRRSSCGGARRAVKVRVFAPFERAIRLRDRRVGADVAGGVYGHRRKTPFRMANADENG
jgi:hypothetical protein